MSTPGEINALKDLLTTTMAEALDYDNVVNLLEGLGDLPAPTIANLRSHRPNNYNPYKNMLKKKMSEFWTSVFLGNILDDLKQRAG